MRNRSIIRKHKFRMIEKRKKLLKSKFNYIPKYEGLLTNNNEANRANYHKIKTNTRKSCASYRHHGDYGEANKYSPHDRRQIQDMKYQLKEYLSNI